MENKEHKIGERFKDGDTLLETVKCEFCEGCFYRNNGCSHSEIHGPCCESDRTDDECVIFKEIKDMKEENSNKDEHFYIWGVPNRGEDVKELLESKGVNCTLDSKEFFNKDVIIYKEHGVTLCIDKKVEPSLCNLITSNWTELKLPWKPKDKELVWAWDDDDDCRRAAIFYDYQNNCSFSYSGERDGHIFDNYAPFEGEYPEWAKEAFNKLED